MKLLGLCGNEMGSVKTEAPWSAMSLNRSTTDLLRSLLSTADRRPEGTLNPGQWMLPGRLTKASYSS